MAYLATTDMMSNLVTPVKNSHPNLQPSFYIARDQGYTVLPMRRAFILTGIPPPL
ncbi:Protein of unknown function [Pyronema omphalodes CBS 100304]|uniref:Uncharacterized protein n=1 Tax=Pyronema omphalodes (strain CBS 100304) TaxID=1076935 RepID=U4LS77_PYROM|nr:Protein of unknown function [Pyronema omphalodes CBS 100304]